jgi:hypothetical protein
MDASRPAPSNLKSLLPFSQEKEYPTYIPRGTATHVGGKLLVATRSAPNTVRGEAYCIGYIDAPERSYGVYQIHIKTAFFSGMFVLSLLFVLDNNVFHEHEEWSAFPRSQAT